MDRLMEAFVGLSAEKLEIEKEWHEVQQATGNDVDSPPATPDFRALLMGDPVAVGVNTKTHGLYYSPGITKVMSKDQLEGILAHELGHVVLRTAGQENGEIMADVWAAEHGYGPQLVSALEKIGEMFPDDTDGGGEHPPDDLRIKTIKEHMA